MIHYYMPFPEDKVRWAMQLRKLTIYYILFVAIIELRYLYLLTCDKTYLCARCGMWPVYILYIGLYTMYPHIDHLREPCHEDKIDRDLLQEMFRSRDSIFSEICDGIGVSDNNVRAAYLNKPAVTKAKLCSWLETVCCILDSFSIPHLHTAVERVEQLNSKISRLDSERITDKNTIIELQSKVIIGKRDEETEALRNAAQVELESVQSTVKIELQSYSSGLTKTCSAALAPKKIRAAAKTVANKEDRSKNLVIYGVAEPENGEVRCDRVSEVLLEIGEKPVVGDCCRVGTVKTDAVRTWLAVYFRV